MAALSLREFYHKYGTGVPNSWEQCEQIWSAATQYEVENCHSLQQLNVAIALLNDMVKIWDAHGVIHKDSWYYERANAVIAQQATI